jgi:hypothetical protein
MTTNACSQDTRLQQDSKLCIQCNECKPYDPMAVRYTKASGFHGSKCWDCYVKNQREYTQDWRNHRHEMKKASNDA